VNPRVWTTARAAMRRGRCVCSRYRPRWRGPVGVRRPVGHGVGTRVARGGTVPASPSDRDDLTLALQRCGPSSIRGSSRSRDNPCVSPGWSSWGCGHRGVAIDKQAPARPVGPMPSGGRCGGAHVTDARRAPAVVGW